MKNFFKTSITETTASVKVLEFDVGEAYNGKKVMLGYLDNNYGNSASGEATPQARVATEGINVVESTVVNGIASFNVPSIKAGMLVLADSTGQQIGEVTPIAKVTPTPSNNGGTNTPKPDDKKEDTLPKTGTEESRIVSHLTTIEVVCVAWLGSMAFISRAAKKYRASK